VQELILGGRIANKVLAILATSFRGSRLQEPKLVACAGEMRREACCLKPDTGKYSLTCWLYNS
jgi:hypothetical protein